MIDSNAKVCVVYLAWLPYGVQHSEISSDRIAVMKQNTHMIWSLLFNGLALPHQDGPEAYLQYMKEAGVSVFLYINFSKGQDIEIYSQMAGNLHHDFILYLNTYSVLLTDQWLKLYVQGWGSRQEAFCPPPDPGKLLLIRFWIEQMDVGRESFTNFIRKIKLMIKASLYWRFLFDKFPNHHVRTNAFFFTERALFEKVTGGFVFILNSMLIYLKAVKGA